jgi:hypothetical protein
MKIPWRALALGAAAGAALLACFVVPAGSAVAIVALCLVAAATGAIALLANRCRATAHAIESLPSETPQPPRAVIRPADLVGPAGGAGRGDPVGPVDPAGGPAADPLKLESLPRMSPSTPPPDGDWPSQPEPAVPPEVAAAAHRLAADAAAGVSAPAAAVLTVQGRRLRAAGTAGDWAEARRLLRGPDEARLPGASLGARGDDSDDDAPPEFPLDEHMPLVLAQYARAIPMEQWADLADAPPFLLPLAALADRGAGAAVSVRYRRRLAGVLVVARRPDKRFSASDLAALERLASAAGPTLGAALARSGQRA